MHTTRFFIAGLLLLLGFEASAQTPESDEEAPPSVTQQLLVGKWQAVSITRYADGVQLPPQPFPADGVVEYSTDGTWKFQGNGLDNSGTFVWIGDNRIRVTTLKSNQAHLVGFTIERDVKVTQDSLTIDQVQTAEELQKLMPVNARLPQRNEVVIVYHHPKGAITGSCV